MVAGRGCGRVSEQVRAKEVNALAQKLNFQERAAEASEFATILSQLRSGRTRLNFQERAAEASEFATILSQLRRERVLATA